MANCHDLFHTVWLIYGLPSIDGTNLSDHIVQSGKSATIWESNHGSGVCKEHYA